MNLEGLLILKTFMLVIVRHFSCAFREHLDLKNIFVSHWFQTIPIKILEMIIGSCHGFGKSPILP